MPRYLADSVVVVHAAFVAFVVLGGFVVLRWRWMAWVHVPAALWGALVEYAGWICPLTPIENDLRSRAGLTPYVGDFVSRCLLPSLYPADLTRTIQILLGTFVIALNAAIYTVVVRRARRTR